MNLFLALFGLTVAIGGSTAIFAFVDLLTAQALWGAQSLPADVIPFKNFIYGPLGGTILAVHVLMAAMAHSAFPRREVWARNAMAGALLGWFIPDSAVSIYYGAYFNVVIFNLFALLVIGIPLAIMWRQFGGDVS